MSVFTQSWRRAQRVVARANGKQRFPQISRWQVGQSIHVGQWTEIYLARPVGMPANASCDYLLKVAVCGDEPEHASFARSCLAREAHVAQQVSHAHLITVLDGDFTSDLPWLIQPYCGTDMLRTCVQQSCPLPEILWYVRQTCEALQALHQAGWLHGDVCPENVAVNENGHVTLIDLGFTRKIDSLECNVAHAPFLGRVAYAPPEAFSAAGSLTSAADMYALGVVLFELLAGNTPFANYAGEEVIAAKRLLKPLDLKQLNVEFPYALTQLVSRLLSRDALRRPTASEVMEQCLVLEVETFSQR
jgi:eukaryotic-like serine/threonine-protein kinase